VERETKSLKDEEMKGAKVGAESSRQHEGRRGD
jgi:hypothetical protein